GNVLINAVILITVFAVVTRILGFAFRIVLGRILTAESLGVYQIALSFFGVLLTIVSSGLPIAISKETAKAAGNKNKIMQCAIAGLIISLVTSLMLCAIVLLLNKFFAFLFPSQLALKILIVLLPAVVASSIYATLRGVWWGQKKFFLLGFTELFEQTIRILFFVIMSAGIMGIVDKSLIAGISLSTACVVSGLLVIIIFIYQNRKTAKNQEQTATDSIYKNTVTNNPTYKPLFKSAIPITAMRGISSLIQPIIAVVIPLRLMAAGFTQSQALSAFGIALGMTFPLLFMPNMIIGSLATALVPDLSSAHQKNNTKEIVAKVSASLKFTLFICFILIPIYIGLGPQIGEFLFNNALSGHYLAQAAWIIIPLSLSLITNSILNSLGYEILSARNYFLGAILLLLSIWFLPEYIGINALAVGMGLCMTLASILNIMLIQQKVKSNFRLPQYFFAFCLVVIMPTILALQSYAFLNLALGSFLALTITGLITFISTIILCEVFNIATISSLFMYFNKKRGNT
ncbi:MAG: oligosaccharide flippase family protein, partial [Firmicutes bacterium]|nr:oligosaccharide flippase family protein [Bacillota bacterium]